MWHSGRGVAMKRAMANKRMSNRRSLALACAGVVTAALAPAVRAQANPEIIYDVRIAGSGAKTAKISGAAGTLNLELYALVADLDLNPSNTGFNSAQGAWMSGNGGLTGNFATSLVSPFDDSSGS